MAVVLLAIMLAGLLIIATEPLNHISKAAVAMFAGVCCWLLYIAQGNNFVSSNMQPTMPSTLPTTVCKPMR